MEVLKETIVSSASMHMTNVIVCVVALLVYVIGIPLFIKWLDDPRLYKDKATRICLAGCVAVVIFLGGQNIYGMTHPTYTRILEVRVTDPAQFDFQRYHITTQNGNLLTVTDSQYEYRGPEYVNTR